MDAMPGEQVPVPPSHEEEEEAAATWTSEERQPNANKKEMRRTMRQTRLETLDRASGAAEQGE